MSVPFLVTVAWSIVEKLIEDWQENPNLFSTERDIQAELYSRLKITLLNLNEYYVQDNPSESIIDNQCRFLWPRLNCEYPVRYNWKGEDSIIKPDIILWDDLDSSKYPDIKKRYKAIENEEDNWPILWTCEIKFDCSCDNEHASSGEIINWFSRKDTKHYNWDVDKMKTLLSYGKKGTPYYGTQYAAVLNMVKVVSKGKGIHWDTNYKGKRGKFWMLHAYLPEDKFRV